MTAALFETSIKSLPFLSRGKVRDIYAVDAEHLLIVTTDRLSADRRSVVTISRCSASTA